MDASTEEVHYDDNAMTVKFVVGRTYKNYEDPFHVGTILEAFQGKRTLFTKSPVVESEQGRNQNIRPYTIWPNAERERRKRTQNS